jgi:hypothetical protein
MKKAKKKKRVIRLRFRKNDAAHNLLAAVQHWVIANGGKLVMVGGIETQSMSPSDYRFKVAIGCIGDRPEKPASTLGQGESK